MGEAVEHYVSNFAEKTGEILSFMKYKIFVTSFSVVMSLCLQTCLLSNELTIFSAQHQYNTSCTNYYNFLNSPRHISDFRITSLFIPGKPIGTLIYTSCIY